MRSLLRYESVRLCAYVAAGFALLVCGLLVADAVVRLTKVPLESPQFLQLQARLADNPGDADTIEQIRALDLALRRQYFQQQHFTLVGSYLLLAGLLVALSACKWAATLRRKLPLPVAREAGPDSDQHLSRTGMWAVTALIAGVLITIGALSASSHTSLPPTLEQLAALERGAAPASAEASGPAGPALPELPSAAERLANWPRFRGCGGAGTSVFAEPPMEWDAATGEGILWQAEVPLAGNNSPVVWQDRLFITGANERQRVLYCFDVNTGNLQWQTEVGHEDGGPAATATKVNNQTGYAASSVATDGRFVYALFATGALAAVDFSGKHVWGKSLGIPDNPYGHASSLTTHQGRIIVQYDQGTETDGRSKLMAIDGATGRAIWTVTRPVVASWASPIVIDQESDQGEPLVVSCTTPWVFANSALSGIEVWKAKLLDRAEVGPSPIYRQGWVYVANDGADLFAIPADASGDATALARRWDLGELPDTISPLASDQFLFLMASWGTLACYHIGQPGEPLWLEEFEVDASSSPSLVGNRVCIFALDGKGWMLEVDADGCHRVGGGDLGEAVVTSPAFQDGRMFIRGEKHLFCIGN
jgi:outer membrane protein assembly factor BamB